MSRYQLVITYNRCKSKEEDESTMEMLQSIKQNLNEGIDTDLCMSQVCVATFNKLGEEEEDTIPTKTVLKMLDSIRNDEVTAKQCQKALEELKGGN